MTDEERPPMKVQVWVEVPSLDDAQEPLVVWAHRNEEYISLGIGDAHTAVTIDELARIVRTVREAQ